MLANDQKAIIEAQVKQHLPDMKDKPEEDLYAMIGKEMVSDTLPESEVEQAGKAWFETNVLTDPRMRTVICENTDGIMQAAEQIVTVQNVTAVVGAVAPLLGLPSIAIPAAAIAVGVLLIKMGLRRYCQGYSPKD
jgi:hypothetical protein